MDTSRQWPRNVAEVTAHHLRRYEFAGFNSFGRVLDASCGCGYGSWWLRLLRREVVGVDVSQDAIGWANKFFKGPQFICGRIEDSPWEGKFETVVSLETIEHVEDPMSLLKPLREACVGRFLVSVPNEEVYKFKPENFINDESPHFRHYTPKEFDELLSAAGFSVTERLCQKSKNDPEVKRGTDGMFLIYGCE